MVFLLTENRTWPQRMLNFIAKVKEQKCSYRIGPKEDLVTLTAHQPAQLYMYINKVQQKLFHANECHHRSFCARTYE